jgi:hypothetical protein
VGAGGEWGINPQKEKPNLGFRLKINLEQIYFLVIELLDDFRRSLRLRWGDIDIPT